MTAQFGVGNRKQKGGTSFQELNEMAKKEGAGGGGGGGPADMDALMKQMGIDPSELKKVMGDIDPDMMKGLADLGPAFDEMMKMMAEMSPEELQEQMKQAMDLMSSTEMMDSMFQNKDLVLKQLEEAGVVDPTELARLKADPEYLEQKMKDGFGQMKELFNNPDTVKLATEAMKGATEMFQNPEKLNEMMAEMMKGISDEQIEEARKKLLGEGSVGDNAMLKQMLAANGGATIDLEEVQAMLNDPQKFRDTIKQGIKVGAGVGEL